MWLDTCPGGGNQLYRVLAAIDNELLVSTTACPGTKVLSWPATSGAFSPIEAALQVTSCKANAPGEWSAVGVGDQDILQGCASPIASEESSASCVRVYAAPGPPGTDALLADQVAVRSRPRHWPWVATRAIRRTGTAPVAIGISDPGLRLFHWQFSF